MRTRDANKEKIIRQKALEMIVEEGFDGLSMQRLAKVAAVSPATIYIYFKDREDLILQLCVELNKRISDATLKGFDPQMHFDEGMKVQWINRAKYCMKYPKEMYFIEQIRFSPFYEKSVAMMDKTFITAMGTFVNNAIKRGELTSLPIEVFWSIAFAPLYAMVKFHMSEKGFPGGKKFVLTNKIMMRTLEHVLKALRP